MKRNNKFYENVEIDMHNLGDDLAGIADCSDMEEDDSGHNSSGCNDCKTYMSADQSSLVTDSHSSDSGDGKNEDEADDPQNKYMASVNETCLESFVTDYPVTITLTEIMAMSLERSLTIYQPQQEMKYFLYLQGKESTPSISCRISTVRSLSSPCCFQKDSLDIKLKEK